MRREEFSIGELTVGKIYSESGFDITPPGGNPFGAADYIVDGNVTLSGTGKGYGKNYVNRPFKTLSEAIAASNASIGAAANRWWARRNRIFVCGDQEIDENLTVLPEKCDVIGFGADILPFPRIQGNHTIAAAAVGTRFVNCGFIAKGTGDLFKVPAGCHGLGFYGCHMYPATVSSKALAITNCAHVRIVNNTITVGAGNMTKIFALAISIEGTASIHDLLIQGNKITATAGIHIVEAAAKCDGGVIADNYIRATGKAINDASNEVQVINNRWMTDIDTTTSTAGYTFNIQLACGNIQMGATGLGDSIPFVKIAE